MELGKVVTSYTFRGLLFDLDGTLVDSIAAVDRSWRTWSTEFGLDPDYVVPRIHGRRAVDSIALLGPQLDQAAAFARLEHLEATDTDGVVALPGALAFVESLKDIPWGIVTSGSQPIAVPRLRAGGITAPEVFITAEQIAHGKPHPEAFLAGAQRLNIPPSEIIAFEDTLAGVRSAKAAGMRVVGVTDEAGEESDVRIVDYRQVSIDRSSEPYRLNIN